MLANIEAMNAEFIRMALPQSARLIKLNEIAIRQLQSLAASGGTKSLGDGTGESL